MYRPDIDNGDTSYRANIYMAAFLIVAYLVLWRFSQDFFFFWDTVENASILAHSYYENGFQFSIFLNDIHAGQFPLFGVYLSALWQIAGRTLEVSHFSVVPFLILNAWLIWKIGTRHFNFYGGMLFVIMMLVQPTYLSHSILVSPKIIVMTAFLVGLYGIERKRTILMWLSSGILIMSNDMGYLFLFGMLIWLFIRYFLGNRSKHMKRLLIPVVTVSSMGLLFWFFYGVQNDFRQIIFFNTESFQAIIQTMVDRILELHAILWDFGMFVFYLMILLLYYMHDSIDRERFRYWISLFVSLYIAVFFHALFLDNPSSHSFYLPVHFAVIALYMSMVAERIEIRQFGWNIVIALLILLSGNFWVYPVEYEQGWSSNISHIPYYEVRKDMNKYLRKREIKYSEVGTAFPNTYSTKVIDLDTTERKMKKYDMKQDQYILYSNVFNSFTSEERMALQNPDKYQLLHEESLTNISMKLYKKND